MHFKLFRQLEGMDCGPACIQMVAHHYGKTISLYKLRDWCNVTRLGVTGGDLVSGLNALHMDNKACVISKKDIGAVPLPVILHWRQKHFVVLYDIKKRSNSKFFYIADPQYGKIKITEEQFNEEWNNGEDSGFVLLALPTDEFDCLEPDKVTFREKAQAITEPFKTYFCKYRKKFILALALSILIMAANWAMPFFFQNAVDYGIGEKNLPLFVMLMLGQLVFFIGYSISGAVNNVILTKLGFSISVDFLTQFLFKIIRLPISYFDTRLNTDLIQRMEDQRKLQNLLTNQLQLISLAVINFIVFSAILIYYNFYVFAIYFVFAVISVLYTKTYLNRLKILNYSKFSLDSESKNLTYEMINGMPEIKINNAQETKINEWETVQHKINKISLKTLFNTLYLNSGTSFITQFAQIIILILSAYFVINGWFTIGVMMTITYVIGQLTNATNSVINFTREVVETMVSVERINEVYRRDDENGQQLLNLEKTPYKISLEDVSFKYEGSFNPYVLHNINLTIPKNQILAIVGASGSGKTTLMKLLLSFYKPQKGAIFLDDLNINDCNTDTWRKHCGVVMQDGYIYSGTITQNIALAEETPDMDKVIRAAKIACIDSFIETLPISYNTSIGNNGLRLSGGQIQRILIARAVYSEPDYLFFDEATSSLDAHNEKEIMNNLYDFFHGKTVIIIAHRLSTVKNADKIIFMDRGMIVEEGSHSQLISSKGSYFHLIKDQLELGK